MASAASGGGGGGSVFGSLRRFDAYPKTMEDFRIKTCGGATSKLSFPIFSFFFHSLFSHNFIGLASMEMISH